MDDNMDANIDPADQSQAFPTARPITECLNFAITGSGEWSAKNLFIFPENVTHPEGKLKNCEIVTFHWLNIMFALQYIYSIKGNHPAECLYLYTAQ